VTAAAPMYATVHWRRSRFGQKRAHLFVDKEPWWSYCGRLTDDELVAKTDAVSWRV